MSKGAGGGTEWDGSCAAFAALCVDRRAQPSRDQPATVRVDTIGHFKPCMTDIYLHIDARMADYIRTHS